jgi:hypothetical protein
MAEFDDVGSYVEVPYEEYGDAFPPDQFWHVSAPNYGGPPAQVYAGGGAVDTMGGYDDYGAGRITRTPAERRENRERRAAKWTPPSPDDDWGAAEWDRFGTRHGYNPLSYGMEALARLDSAGRGRDQLQDVWDVVNPNPDLYGKTGSLAGAFADVASLMSLGLGKRLGMALGAALPITYDLGYEGGNALLGHAEGGEVAAYRDGGRVSKTIRTIADKFGRWQGDRAEQAADLTNLERLSDKSLMNIFDPKNSGLFVAMPTDAFQDYAPIIPEIARNAVPYPRWSSSPRGAIKGLRPEAQTLDEYLDRMGANITKATDYSPSPALWLRRNLEEDTTDVVEHEGRHRMMALDRLGDKRGLVHLLPVNEGELRHPLDERFEMLLEKYFPQGGETLVRPQDFSGIKGHRGLSPLYEEPFSEGGRVLSRIVKSVLGKPERAKLPSGDYIDAQPIREFEDVADTFARRAGNDYPIDSYPPFDEERARRIAQAYEEMQHDPLDPRVRRSYDALIDETMDQYRALEGTGAKFEFLRPGEADPYAASPALGYLDLLSNGRLKVFPTESGFGSLSDISDNPLLRRVGRVGDLDNATANDAFRVVHDALGHFGPGNPFFRHQGEERAWLNHMRAYSDDALPAATSETRGQNSWVNFGPYGERNRTASGADTTYADQKTGLLPEWVYEREGFKTGGIVDTIKKAWKTRKAESLQKEVEELNTGRDPSQPFISPDVAPRLQTVGDPRRVMFPGIYKDPRDVVEDARSKWITDPGEEGAMFRLFGHTRDSLDELSQGNRFLDAIDPPAMPWDAPVRGRGSKISDQVLTNRNAGRVQDVLDLALSDPQLRTTRSWYEMSPLWDKMSEMGLGDKTQRALNTRMGVMSPGSDPPKEINRGFFAHYLGPQGRTEELGQFGMLPMSQRPDHFPEDLTGLIPHPYTNTAHMPNLRSFEATGELSTEKHKVPTYIMASDPVWQFGGRPVADAHFTRFLGYPDVRTGAAAAGNKKELSPSEYGDMLPWWRKKIAEELDMRDRDAQALMWNVGGPQTGVSYIGPPKLEMISNQIDAAAKRLGIPLEEAAYHMLSGESPGFADGGSVEDDMALWGSQNYADGGRVGIAKKLAQTLKNELFPESNPRRDLFLRFGEVPVGERSRNFTMGEPGSQWERGVSVYDLAPRDVDRFEPAPFDYPRHLQPMMPENGSRFDFLERLESREPRYIVQGRRVGRGADWEPVLRDVEKLGTWGQSYGLMTSPPLRPFTDDFADGGSVSDDMLGWNVMHYDDGGPVRGYFGA